MLTLHSRGSCMAAVLVAAVALAAASAFCQEEVAGQGGAPTVPAQAGAPAQGTAGAAESTPDAQAAIEKAGQGQVELALADAIVMALKNSLDVKVVSYEPHIAAKDIDRQWSPYDPFLSGSVSYTNRRPPYTDFKTVERSGAVLTVIEGRSKTDSDVTSYNAGMSAKMPSGGVFSVSAVTARNVLEVDTHSVAGGVRGASRQTEDFYSTDLAFQLVQPLLKNAGERVNKAFIRVAQNNARASTYQFEDQIMNVVLNTTNAYWNLVFTRDNLKVQEKSLAAAQDLLKNNNVKYNAGALPRIEVTRARARVADREEAIVNAKAAIKDAEDVLRRILDSPGFAPLSEAEIVPTDRPSVFAEQIDVVESVHTAMALRPDVRQQLVMLESLGILMARAKHQLLPQLDVQATYTVNGLDNSFSGDTELLAKLDRRGISTGLALSYPLGNRLARSDYMQTYYQRLQGLVTYEALERTVTLAVKKSVRDIATSLQRIETNQARKQFAQENLEAEIQKFDVGQSISLDVLDAQEQLRQAESDYLQSIVGFNTAMAGYYRTCGRILQKYGIEVLEQSTIKKGSQVIFE